MTTENDPDLFQDQSELAGKYPDNTTIVYMDKNGNYIQVEVFLHNRPLNYRKPN
jgi:hypothetical protein